MSGPSNVAAGDEASFLCLRDDLLPGEDIDWQVTAFSGEDVHFEGRKNGS